MNFEILVATTNAHKLQEIREILSPHHITVYGLNDLNIKSEEVEENGETYFDNALIKAEALQNKTEMPIIADDTGLEILSMNNEPGLFTARYASNLGGYGNAFKDIFTRLEGMDRSATFICDIALVNVEEHPLKFEGRVEGSIATEIRGNDGFGYDPIFIVNEASKTYAEMSREEKNRLSHRGKALLKLITYLKINNLIN